MISPLKKVMLAINAHPESWDQSHCVSDCGTRFCLAGHASAILLGETLTENLMPQAAIDALNLGLLSEWAIDSDRSLDQLNSLAKEVNVGDWYGEDCAEWILRYADYTAEDCADWLLRYAEYTFDQCSEWLLTYADYTLEGGANWLLTKADYTPEDCAKWLSKHAEN